MTYREAILLGESILQKAKIVDAKNDAWLLLAMACRINHTYYYVHMDEEMSQEQIREYQALLSKRAERIPLQYIVGEQMSALSASVIGRTPSFVAMLSHLSRIASIAPFVKI